MRWACSAEAFRSLFSVSSIQVLPNAGDPMECNPSQGGDSESTSFHQTCKLTPFVCVIWPRSLRTFAPLGLDSFYPDSICPTLALFIPPRPDSLNPSSFHSESTRPTRFAPPGLGW
eukprot:11635352-Alexandrium_andersonii.AAC.1